MQIGFTYKDKHTSDFGVTALTQSRPVLPEVKSYTFEAAAADGEYDFTEANEFAREFYKDRVIEVDIQAGAGNIDELQHTVTRLSKWLCGKGELIFDDIPLVIWDARIIDTVTYKPELAGRKTVLSVSFRAKPLARLVFEVPDGPVLDDKIPLDSNIPLDMTSYFIFTGQGDHRFINIGDAPVKPILTVSGAASLTCNGHTLTVPRSCTVDCERQVVTDASGNSIMNAVTGSFFELAAGDNTLYISADITVQARYTPQFIYNADFDDVEWGD